MRTGTISETVLKRSVLKNICYRSDCLVSGPAVGQKCGAQAVAGGKQMVFSEVSVTGCAGVAEEIAFERLRNADNVVFSGSRGGEGAQIHYE